MELDTDLCYRALAARDARFDGVFFVGVVTTRIYCRPICPARSAARTHCRFFASAASAERAGFRPCLRCRPELAPGNAPVDANGRLAEAVAARIRAGALNDGGSVEELACEFGRSSRQLRRALRLTFGVSPVELAQTHRLLLAKQLLTETHLPIIRVAFASGFGSVRRFNALFRSHYRLTPGRVRKARHAAGNGECLRLSLSYRPPLAWEELLRFLADRACPGVEAVVGDSYMRTAAIGKAVGWLRVQPITGRNVLQVELATVLAPVLPAVLNRLRNLFDLNARPDIIVSHLADNPYLGPAVKACPGLRVPGAFDGFELTVRAILGQQVSVRAATTLMGRLAKGFGLACETPFAELHGVGPTADKLASANLADIIALGLPTTRASCLLSLARTVASGTLVVEPCPEPEQLVERLQQLPGVGEWTANYTAMRAARWPDAFPHGDLALRRNLGNISATKLLEVARPWRPWRAYAAMHLWNLSNLASKGVRHA